MLTRYVHTELAKHKVSTQEVDFVLRSDITIWFDLGPSPHGNDRLMFVGFGSNGRLLEIAIEYLDDEIELVFHANDATLKYQKLFERKRI